MHCISTWLNEVTWLIKGNIKKKVWKWWIKNLPIMNSKILKSTTRDMIKAPHRAVKSRLAAGGYLQVRTLWGKKKRIRIQVNNLNGILNSTQLIISLKHEDWAWKITTIINNLNGMLNIMQSINKWINQILLNSNNYSMIMKSTFRFFQDCLQLVQGSPLFNRRMRI